jgi:hypothetical protein
MRWLTYLLERLRAAWRALQAVPYQPTRVGLLNTGELVLIDGLGQPMVFSSETTGLVRSTLIDTDPGWTETFIDLSRGRLGETGAGAPLDQGVTE